MSNITSKATIRVLVASQNPVKINAAREAFTSVTYGAIEVTGISVESGVAEQPLNYEQTRLGAENRVLNMQTYAEQNDIAADFYVAYEGGVDVFEDGPKTFAVLCLSDGSTHCFGQTATLPLPVSVYQQLVNGEELGVVMDKLFATNNVKQKGGAIGLLTNGVESRTSIYTSATILALSRFLHQSMFD